MGVATVETLTLRRSAWTALPEARLLAETARLERENGLLSYENPNYHLDPARLESAIYSDLYDMHDDKDMPLDYDNYLDNRR
ncbi:unnamed protein product [Euphydryas editha]|uniref:Uncharacterized protein n=1 Tax=Euphydryas editha TaxID=104508 RepID=A0AAU9TM63_EUPED|nr:unnamed protein product [Euphydryas editha]